MSVVQNTPPWRDMSRGRPAKKITLEQEQELIRAAKAGDRQAADRLIRYYQPFAIQVAKRAVWFTGAVRQEDDLVQIALLTLFEKIKNYDFSYIAQRRKKEPGYRAARLSSYAFREIRRRMMAFACKNLEIVPGATSSVGHAAHRQLDQGVPAAEVAARFGLELATVEHLGRHTITLEEWGADSADDSETVPDQYDDDQHRLTTIRECWFALEPLHRLALALMHHEAKAQVRRKALGLKRLGDLAPLETAAREALCRLVAERDAACAEDLAIALED